MATEPQHVQFTLAFERTKYIRESAPVTETSYRITASEAEVIIERDVELRRQAAADPESVEARTIEEIAKDLSGDDYNTAKKYLRHSRYVKISGPDDDEDLSILDITPSHQGDDPSEVWAMRLMVRHALAQLDPKDRAVLIDVHVAGLTRTEVAKYLGVSQPAVSKRLKKAEEKLRELLGGEWL